MIARRTRSVTAFAIVAAPRASVTFRRTESVPTLVKVLVRVPWSRKTPWEIPPLPRLATPTSRRLSFIWVAWGYRSAGLRERLDDDAVLPDHAPEHAPEHAPDHAPVHVGRDVGDTDDLANVVDVLRSGEGAAEEEAEVGDGQLLVADDTRDRAAGGKGGEVARGGTESCIDPRSIVIRLT